MKSRTVTSKDVAHAAGVSRTTVSMVLNNVQGVQISEQTRQRVLEAAKQLGYVPDAAGQALASRRSQIIGLVMARQSHHIITDAFMNMLMDGFLRSTHQTGMRLMVDFVEPQHHQKAYLQLVRAKRIDGLLLAGPRLDDEGLKLLEEANFPTVLIGHIVGTSLYSVDIDNRGAAREAVAYLIQLGHRQIACITNAPPSYGAPALRLQGYRDALDEAGIPYDTRLVRFGDYDMHSGYEQMNSLLSDGMPFTAAFVSSDVVALGAAAAINERGLKIPGQISLIGFDDVPMARFMNPPLTTIHVPASEMGQTACELLTCLIMEGSAPQSSITLEASLLVRDSCSAPNSR
ncbi:MAG: LacI family DNA-binding transcriptional regulator [Anaerolineales bacterium]|nr:LacI family DNA-binding transcriptional regulator [Anaerolineales bacterium]